MTGSVDARGRGKARQGSRRIESRVRVPRVISRKNAKRQSDLERTRSARACRYCVTRRAERRAKGGEGGTEGEWVNGRLVGSFKRREIVSRRNFSEGRAARYIVQPLDALPRFSFHG